MKMKKLLLIIGVLFTALTVNAVETDYARYGYAPEVFAEENIRGLGSGENGFIAGMICLDPSIDPVVARLKGKQIIGVKCYLRNDYKQAKKGRSLIMCATGSVEAEPVIKTCDFLKGWNEYLFDEPIVLGEEPVYLGYQVYEGRSSAYPLAAFADVFIPGTCYVNVKESGWTEFTDRGVLLIEAIFEDDAKSELEKLLYAQIAESPMVVAPSAPFDATVYFNNQTGAEILSAKIEIQGEGDETAYAELVTFDSPLLPREGRVLPMSITSGREEGMEQWIRISVKEVNGLIAQENRVGETKHYVSGDAFVRVPLIEEFTSQSCQACPFMSYYLDLAMEEYEGELVYVTHHAGFAPDRFTKPVDNQLLYLFGEEPTFNPAVMFDRTVPNGEYSPIVGASLAEVDPYLLTIQEMAKRPAKASVDVDAVRDGTKVSCEVSGKVSSAMVDAGEEMYLSTYLVEYGIPVSTDPTSPNYQKGLTDEGAPEDILEVVKHSGVIRHNYNTEHLGDLLTFDNYTYKVSYDAVEVKDDWNLENCRVVSFVHKINPEDLTDNYVLNAGYYEFNPASVESVATSEYVRIYSVDGGRIMVSDNVSSYDIYDMQGVRLNANNTMQQGVYLVKYETKSGNAGVKKLYVK